VAADAVDRLILGAWPWLLVSPAHEPVDPKAVWPTLARTRLLFGPTDDWPKALRMIQAAEGPRIAPTVLKTSRDGLLSLVAAGAGHCLVPECVAADISRRDLSFTRLPDPVPPVVLAAAWAPENDNPALRRFLSRLKIRASEGKVAAE